MINYLNKNYIISYNNIMEDFEAKMEGSAPTPSNIVNQEVAENVVIEEVIESKPKSKRFFKKK